MGCRPTSLILVSSVHPLGPVAAISAPRAVVMGVVNVTPDSFSDGGEWFSAEAATAHGIELLAAGADLVDVGGESTRPGAARVPPEVELERILPTIAALAQRGAVVSVDTTRAQVAAAALGAGATLVNDVSGGLADPEILDVVAQARAPYVVMHWRGHADVMDALARYEDVVVDVRRELSQRVEAALAAGVQEDQIILDPGLGFAKPGAANWPLLARLAEIRSLGLPVLVGASRKRFLGHLLAGPGAPPAPPLDRDDATTAITALAARDGAWGVRVHDAAAGRAGVLVAAAWRAAETPLTSSQDDGAPA